MVFSLLVVVVVKVVERWWKVVVGWLGEMWWAGLGWEKEEERKAPLRGRNHLNQTHPQKTSKKIILDLQIQKYLKVSSDDAQTLLRLLVVVRDEHVEFARDSAAPHIPQGASGSCSSGSATMGHRQELQVQVFTLFRVEFQASLLDFQVFWLRRMHPEPFRDKVRVCVGDPLQGRGAGERMGRRG